MRSPTLYLSSVLFHEGAKFCDIDQGGAQSVLELSFSQSRRCNLVGIMRDSLSLTEDGKSEILSESEFSSLSCPPEKSQTGDSVRK